MCRLLYDLPDAKCGLQQLMCSITVMDLFGLQISARLTKYKMQGMLASDMVERPVAYKPDTDQVLLPLTHVSTHPALHAHSSATMPMGRQADFDSPDDILPGTGSLFSRQALLCFLQWLDLSLSAIFRSLIH